MIALILARYPTICKHLTPGPSYTKRKTQESVAMLCQVDLAAIQAAYPIVQETARITPVVTSVRCSGILGHPVYLKLESLQRTGSFKIRGASYKLHLLKQQYPTPQVMAISAGNHAQGIALASQLNQGSATIFMPADAPLAKIQATQDYGARVKCIGKNFDETAKHAMAWLEDHPVTFVSPFDDDDIITGQGTCGLELLQQIPDLDTVIVPVGGGGLISGMAIAMKALRPQVKIIGVQAAAVPSLVSSFKKKKLIQIRKGPTIADGIAIKKPAQRNLEVIMKYVDQMITVSEDEIAQALFFALQSKHLMVEGAGAVGLAALLSHKIQAKGPTAIVLSGGNIDPNLLGSIISKGMLHIGRFLSFETQILDTPGSLKKVLQLIEKQKANVINIQHARTRSDIPLGYTEIMVDLETRNHEHANQIIRALQEKGYVIQRL